MTGKRSYRVMNLRSSRSPWSDGSATATVRVRPSRLSGRTMCFAATSPGMSLRVRGSTSNLRQVDGGHPEVPREQLGDLDLGDDALLGHHVAQAQAGRLGLGGGRRELVASQQTFLQKEVADRDCRLPPLMPWPPYLTVSLSDCAAVRYAIATRALNRRHCCPAAVQRARASARLMPSTRARSEGVRKGPALSRKATIRAARR